MSVLNLITTAWKAFSDWRARERAYTELMALDDRALADIGIRRSQIRAILEADRRADRETRAAAAQHAPALGRHKAA
ncbi:MAG: DUF1127 domain-containing protein [Stellaceae bacterium]